MPRLLLDLNATVAASRLAQLTRDMSRDLSRAGTRAEPVDAPAAPGERGEAITVGQIALGLITSGAVTAVIECLKAYLSRERSLNITLTRPDGAQVMITSHNVDTAAVQQALVAAASVRQS